MCPSEVSDIERSIWQTYRDRGVVVYGIASEDEFEAVVRFRDQLGITFPILFDGDGRVHEQYELQADVAAGYPEDWIIDPAGIVAYVNNHFDVDAMTAILEEELAGR